jgi:hypothetical protein
VIPVNEKAAKATWIAMINRADAVNFNMACFFVIFTKLMLFPNILTIAIVKLILVRRRKMKKVA